MENLDNDPLPYSQAHRFPIVSARVMKAKKTCGYCMGRLQRRKRRGFFEQTIMPYFGKYPWKCTVCGKVQFYRDRG